MAEASTARSYSRIVGHRQFSQPRQYCKLNFGGGGVPFSRIPNGATLNIVSNGSLTIGKGTLDFGPGATEFVTIGGNGGALDINNTNGTTYVGFQPRRDI